MTMARSGLTDHRWLFVNGGWETPSTDRRIPVLSANTGLPIGSVPDADRVDVDFAVRAARVAFDDPTGWSHWTPAANAGAYFCAPSVFGKFHGTTAATTPRGTRRTIVQAPPELSRISSVASSQIKSA